MTGTTVRIRVDWVGRWARSPGLRVFIESMDTSGQRIQAIRLGPNEPEAVLRTGGGPVRAGLFVASPAVRLPYFGSDLTLPMAGQQHRGVIELSVRYRWAQGWDLSAQWG